MKKLIKRETINKLYDNILNINKELFNKNNINENEIFQEDNIFFNHILLSIEETERILDYIDKFHYNDLINEKLIYKYSMHLKMAIASEVSLRKIENKKNYFIILRKDFEKIDLTKISDEFQREGIKIFYKNLKHNKNYLNLVNEERNNYLNVKLILNKSTLI